MTAGIGHNSGAHPDVLNATAQGQLRSIIERIERLEVERGEINEQIKEVKSEAKGNGFDVAIIGEVIKIRKQDRAKRQEKEAMLDIYMVAIGEAEAFVPARAPASPAPAVVTPPEDDSDLA